MSEWIDLQFSGESITTAISCRYITPLQLAKKIGVTAQQLGQWETGEVIPRADTLAKIANALETPIEFFFARSGKNGNVGDDQEAQ